MHLNLAAPSSYIAKGPCVVRHVIPFIRQHETHGQRAGRMLPALTRRWTGLDAIIVPASRPAPNLDHAVILTQAMNSWLAVFYSRQAPSTFFPEVYNEDWLFFYDDARTGRLGWSGRNATQLYYDPFEHPRRAGRQEFGDVLAEGLYALLNESLGIGAATREYWNQFLVARKDFLENIIKGSDQVAPDIQAKDGQCCAVQEAVCTGGKPASGRSFRCGGPMTASPSDEGGCWEWSITS